MHIFCWKLLRYKFFYIVSRVDYPFSSNEHTGSKFMLESDLANHCNCNRSYVTTVRDAHNKLGRSQVKSV